LIMTVPERVIVFVRISEGNTSRNDFTSRRVHSKVHSVHQKLFETFRKKSIRIQLSNSRYRRQVIESGNDLLNFNSSLILPLFECDD
jgi:hypothetical protein